MKATHFIGAHRPDGIGHFIPWVKVTDAPPDPRIYPAAFTFAQLFELEWAIKSLRFRTSATTGLSGSFDCDATVRNDFLDQENNANPAYQIHSEQDLLRRAGLRTNFNGGDWPTSAPDPLTNVGFNAKIGVHYGAFTAGDDNAKIWFAKGDPPPPEAGPPEVVFMEEETAFPSDTVEGPRIYYYDGFFYPNLLIEMVVGDQDAILGNNAKIYATGNLMTGLGFSMGASGLNVIISGGTNFTLTPVVIPLLATPLFGPGPNSVDFTDDLQIDLTPWDYA